MNEHRYYHVQRESHPHAYLHMVCANHSTWGISCQIPLPKLRRGHNLALRKVPYVWPTVPVREVRLYGSVRILD